MNIKKIEAFNAEKAEKNLKIKIFNHIREKCNMLEIYED